MKEMPSEPIAKFKAKQREKWRVKKYTTTETVFKRAFSSKKKTKMGSKGFTLPTTV